MSLTKLKAIDRKTKYKIHGFVRRHEVDCCVTIPIMIEYIIMLYYWINEKFTEHGDGIELDESSKIIRSKGGVWYNTVCGNNIINADDTSIKSYIWKFRINAIGEQITIDFGIDSSNNKWLNGAFSDITLNTNMFYSIGSKGCVCQPRKFVRALNFNVKEGDHLTLIFCVDHEIKSAKLMCQTQKAGDEVEQEYVAQDGIKLDLHYNLAVSIPAHNETQVEMIQFEISQK